MIQRVRRARVSVGDRVVSSIESGLLVLLGVVRGDGPEEARLLADKTARLRIFEDAEGRMNRSAADASGALLVVSQFTLCADCRRGNRPSFIDAAPPEEAVPLYETYVTRLRDQGYTVGTGEFRARMTVALENDGPVTIVLDTRELAAPRT